MKLSWILLIVIFSVAVVGCGKKKSGQGGPSPMAGSGPGMEPATTPPGMGMTGMGMDPTAPGMKVVIPVTTGPTGIPDCDKLLEVACGCTKKHDSLKISCEAIKKDAPGWKAKAQKQNPKQIEDLRLACVRMMKDIQNPPFNCK